MRVLWLSPWLRPVARNCAESLRALGVDVMLITSDLHPESDAARDYERVLLGRPVPTADWVNVANAYRAASRFKPDVVVTELLRDPRWRVFGRLAPRIAVIHDDQPHDETHEPPWWIRSFAPWDAKADATVVFSKYVAHRVRARGQTSSPIYVAPLVTDLHPSKVPEPVPPGERRNFLLVGRQRPYKNHRVVFAAWTAHTQSASWRNDELIIIGRGDIDSDLPPFSRWIRGGYEYSSVIQQLAAAKGSIVHSRSASQSGVQVMSMQLGIPTLVSSAGGLPEYQPEGLSVTGVDDVEGLASAINTLADPKQVDLQSRIAISHYRENFEPRVAAERLLDIFNAVALRSRAG